MSASCICIVYAGLFFVLGALCQHLRTTPGSVKCGIIRCNSLQFAAGDPIFLWLNLVLCFTQTSHVIRVFHFGGHTGSLHAAVLLLPVAVITLRKLYKDHFAGVSTLLLVMLSVAQAAAIAVPWLIIPCVADDRVLLLATIGGSVVFPLAAAKLAAGHIHDAQMIRR